MPSALPARGQFEVIARQPVKKRVRLGEDYRLAFRRPARKRAVGHGEPRIMRQTLFLPDQKRPIQVVGNRCELTTSIIWSV